jgi:hypothetical protein
VLRVQSVIQHLNSTMLLTIHVIVIFRQIIYLLFQTQDKLVFKMYHVMQLHKSTMQL